jgi:hypothetical protein
LLLQIFDVFHFDVFQRIVVVSRAFHGFQKLEFADWTHVCDTITVRSKPHYLEDDLLLEFFVNESGDESSLLLGENFDVILSFP